jgi:amidohydrolase
MRWTTCLLTVLPLAAQIPEARVKMLEPKLIEMRRDFHMNPELSNREERTSRVVAEKLRTLGLEVKTGVARHGVVALLRGAKPGPVVAWRADMDALPIHETMNVPYCSRNPGVKHACGHDAHTAIGLGIAEVLAGMKSELAGTVKFVFQPAEEGPPNDEEGGAPLMVKEGALENPRPAAIFGLHVNPALRAGTVGYAESAALSSSDTWHAVIRGQSAHGAMPHLGNDAVTAAAQCIMALQTIRSRRVDTLQPLVLTVGVIQGGERFNVIAKEVKLDGTLRTFNEQVREEARTMMRQTLTGCTAAQGATFELKFGDGNPAVINDAALRQRGGTLLERVMGKEKVTVTPPAMFSEDFSYFQKVVPGFYFWLGVSNPEKGITAGLHTAEFDLDEAALTVGVRAGAEMLLDALMAGRQPPG